MSSGGKGVGKELPDKVIGTEAGKDSSACS